MAQIILDSNNNLIQGDFDNATVNNRTKFKTTTTNATTNVYAVPNGSATSAGFTVTNAADPTNASKLTIATNGSTDTQIISGVNGSGTYLPLSFYTNNALAGQFGTDGVFTASKGIVSNGGGAVASNTALGYQTLNSNVSGTENVAVGYQSLYANTTNYNVGIGYRSLYTNTTGTRNTAVGYAPLRLNSTGNDNTSIGYGSLDGNTASSNTAIGAYALEAVTSGSQNTSIGHQSGATGGSGSLTTGSNNIAIGYRAALGSATAANQIMIGTDVSSAGGDNSVNFGKYGNVVYNVFTSNATWTRSSDVRLKKNIVDSELGLDFINKLRTVKYNWKPSYEVPQELKSYNENNYMDLNVTMHGFIAQEVKQALNEVGVSDFAGWSQQEDGTQAISYEMFVMPLVKAIKEQTQIINELKTRIEALESK